VKQAELDPSLRREYVLALGPLALIAPIPLPFTYSISFSVLLLYETAVGLLLWRAFRDHPVRLSDGLLNLMAIGYLPVLFLEVAVLHDGLIRTVSNLLLFTAVAKLASLKRIGEVRLALLLILLLLLDSASNSTHVTVLLYLVAVAWVGFRTLVRIAILADFDRAPPARSLRKLPTAGVTAFLIGATCLAAVPLFLLLPRLRSPFVRTSLAGSEMAVAAFNSNDVALDGFATAKRSDQIIMRLLIPRLVNPEALRLREASYDRYEDGRWSRSRLRRGATMPADRWLPVARRTSGAELFSLRADLFPLGSGFLFLPYGARYLRIERVGGHLGGDGGVRLATTPATVRYEVQFRPGSFRSPSAGPPALEDVPPEVAREAERVTEGMVSPREITRAILRYLQKGFHYTLDPPAPAGDPVTYFLLHSRSGHCEYFASAMVLMLRARGVPARFVTGSLGGEFGFLSDEVVVRGKHLHAWVEADIDGKGYQVFDPTPPSGLPAMERATFWTSVVAMAQGISFFYDRHVLGFDALDQLDMFQSVESTARGLLESGRSGISSLRSHSPLRPAGLLVAAALALWLFGRRRRSAAATGPATAAYLALRRLFRRAVGSLPDSAPPGDLLRQLERRYPACREDAWRLVQIYQREAFGNRPPNGNERRELSARLKRLRRMVG
jgi:protein-glutamine gamma-glutamyltransferase